jgi:hypothetical protein
MEAANENKTKGKRVEIFCSGCSRSTNHLVIVSVDIEGSEELPDDAWIAWADHYQVVQCQGCNAFSFRHLHWFSEEEDPTSGSDGLSERLYPERDGAHLRSREFMSVPPRLDRIYRESIHCFNSECFTLCAAGLRGLVEGICADQKVTDGPVERPAKGGGTRIVREKNLEGKIAGLHEKGILTKSAAETLHEHRYLGNEAVHELTRPSRAELKLAAEIIEHILEELYEIPEKAVELKAEKARRKLRK